MHYTVSCNANFTPNYCNISTFSPFHKKEEDNRPQMAFFAVALLLLPQIKFGWA